MPERNPSLFERVDSLVHNVAAEVGVPQRLVRNIGRMSLSTSVLDGEGVEHSTLLDVTPVPGADHTAGYQLDYLEISEIPGFMGPVLPHRKVRATVYDDAVVGVRDAWQADREMPPSEVIAFLKDTGLGAVRSDAEVTIMLEDLKTKGST